MTQLFNKKSPVSHVLIFFIGVSMLTSSCITVRIRTDKAQGELTGFYRNEKKVKRWFWGKVANGEVLVNTCKSHALQTVEVRPGFGNTLITVFTLGIYCPTRVRWICLAVPEPDPYIPIIITECYNEDDNK